MSNLETAFWSMLPPAYEYQLDKIESTGQLSEHFIARFKIRNIVNQEQAKVRSSLDI
jgi:hypothetical protein